jgi:hypothetical protein
MSGLDHKHMLRLHTNIFILIKYGISSLAVIAIVFTSGCWYTEDTPRKKVLKIEGNMISCLHCGNFGDDIEIEGDFMAITGRGSVNFFERNAESWNLLQEIKYDGTVYYSRIQDIALTPSLLAVSFTDIAGGGTVYLYERLPDGTWSKFQELYGNNEAGVFGHSIHIAGDRMIIGSPDEPGSKSEDRGQAYIFKLDNGEWALESVLESADPGPNNHFGTTVRLVRNYAFVTRDLRDAPVQVFKWDGTTWNFYQSLQNNKGVALANSDNEIVVIGNQLTALAIESGSEEFTPRTFDTVGDHVPNDIFHTGMFVFMLHGDKEFVKVQDEYAFVSAYFGKAMLFKLNGNNWSFEREFSHLGDLSSGNGLAITSQYIALQNGYNAVEVFPR